MYTPAHFAVDDETTRAFLAQIEAADLVTPTTDGLVATFLPLLFDPTRGAHGALLGHVARKNDHWRAAATAESLTRISTSLLGDRSRRSDAIALADGRAASRAALEPSNCFSCANGV